MVDLMEGRDSVDPFFAPWACCSLATNVDVYLGHALKPRPQHPGNEHSLK